MDRDSYKRRLERFSRNERIFPGGVHETGNCTACARIITERFGGEVRGYYHAHNSTARAGETEGGHDFAVTPERFLVDPWLFHYYGESPVLDMATPAGRAEALSRYGPEENWQRIPMCPASVPVRRRGRVRPSQQRLDDLFFRTGLREPRPSPNSTLSPCYRVKPI
jgi:hypothetical protein